MKSTHPETTNTLAFTAFSRVLAQKDKHGYVGCRELGIQPYDRF